MKVSVLCIILAMLSTCSRERSNESRRREEADRQAKRISYAEGAYTGYLVNAENQITPFDMNVQIAKNPGADGENPALSVSLHLGLFGGVTIASTSAYFDWGANELVASFGSTQQGSELAKDSTKNTKGLEFRGTIQDDGVHNSVLVGPHLGQKTVVLMRNGESLFDSKSAQSYRIQWQSKDASDINSILNLKSKSVNQKAPATSDLPYLPGLDATVQFDSFAAAPQNVVAAFYDPTTATLDLQFTDFSWLRISSVALDMNTHKLTTSSGNVNLSGVAIQNIVLAPLDQSSDLKQTPPAAFIGTYQGGPESIKYKAVMYLNFSGSIGVNKPDLPFPNFPTMRMEVDVCNGNEVLEQSVLRLEVLDVLKHRAVFHRMETEQDPLEINFKQDWSIDGIYLQTDPHEGGRKPRVTFQPNADVAQKGCAALP